MLGFNEGVLPGSVPCYRTAVEASFERGTCIIHLSTTIFSVPYEDGFSRPSSEQGIPGSWGQRTLQGPSSCYYAHKLQDCALAQPYEPVHSPCRKLTVVLFW